MPPAKRTSSEIVRHALESYLLLESIIVSKFTIVGI